LRFVAWVVAADFRLLPAMPEPRTDHAAARRQKIFGKFAREVDPSLCFSAVPGGKPLRTFPELL